MIRYGVSLIVFALSACGFESQPTSRQIEASAQENASMHAVRSVGMPAITNFQEKRMLKQILELRDTALTTTTYIVDLNGKLHKICDSVGYGLPYATQYTNPQVMVGNDYHAVTTVAQADPNGLYSPPQAEGTWVQCLDPTTKKIQVLYIEPRVIVSPIVLEAVK